MLSLVSLLFLTIVLKISCLDVPGSTLHLQTSASLRQAPIATHSIEPAFSNELKDNRAQRYVTFSLPGQRIRREDVPASSYIGSVYVSNVSQETTTDIIKETEENDYNGSFNYSFKTVNGISVEMKGYLKTLSNGTVVQAMDGQYSYTPPDGHSIITKWYADETGFHAQGAHIP